MPPFDNYVFGRILFPDTIRAIETRASHWYSTLRMAPQAEKMNLTLDKWVRIHGRIEPAVAMERLQRLRDNG